jgi:hypothetical protein
MLVRLFVCFLALNEDLENIFCKGPDKYFGLCKLYPLGCHYYELHCYSMQMSISHTWFSGLWVCSKNSLLTNTEIWISYNFPESRNILFFGFFQWFKHLKKEPLLSVQNQLYTSRLYKQEKARFGPWAIDHATPKFLSSSSYVFFILCDGWVCMVLFCFS